MTSHSISIFNFDGPVRNSFTLLPISKYKSTIIQFPNSNDATSFYQLLYKQLGPFLRHLISSSAGLIIWILISKWNQHYLNEPNNNIMDKLCSKYIENPNVELFGGKLVETLIHSLPLTGHYFTISRVSSDGTMTRY